MIKNSKIEIRLTSEEHEKLSNFCVKKNKTMSEIIRGKLKKIFKND